MATTFKPKGRSFSEAERLIREALKAQFPNNYVWVSDTYPAEVIFSVENSQPPNKTEQYLATYSIAVDGKVTLGDPQKVMPKRVYEIVTFSIDPAAFAGNSEIVIDAKLFELGDYPDKNFSLNEEEADGITIPSAAGKPIEFEHKPTVLSGKTGFIEKTWRDGTSIYGTLRFSSWVGQALAGETPKLSVAFNPVTKEVDEVSMVRNPRISDASLLAAFSGETVPQETERKGGVMSIFAKLAEKLGLQPKEVETELRTEFAAVNAAESAELKARLAAVEAENKALKQGQTATFAATVDSAATAIVNQIKSEGKITPAEEGPTKTAFMSALLADGGVKFSDDGKPADGEQVAALKAVFAARPNLHLTESQFSGATTVAGSQTAEAPVIDSAKIYAARGAK